MMLKGKQKWSDYKLLRRKLFFGTTIIVAVSAVLVFLAYSFLLRGRFANFVVKFLTDYVYQDRDAALAFYWNVFRDHMDFLLLLSAVGVFLLILRFYMRSFTKYFNQINQGIDAIIQESNNDVVLAPELAATERKINQIKHTLAQRSMAEQIAEQRKNDLVMYLAHDIRTPLTSVIGYLSLLEEVPEMPIEQRAKYVHITLEKAQRLETLVNELFEIARYNLQQIPLEKEEIDLSYMLVQITDEFYPLLSARGNTAVLQAGEDLTVSADPGKLARVFNNILKNAAAYSYPNTEIYISAQEEERMITICIQNEGPTIPAEKLSTIFEKFYRMDDARTSDSGGFGLGLAIAKEIVLLHGGSIAAQSADHVTSFTISLPGQMPGGKKKSRQS
ncbi:MAG: HAMP domain-containing histidine kinase [Ruminiclostridium sp.]|nr:HAMP domain-containing histidine kinase [Ruminiclostridium sp.]